MPFQRFRLLVLIACLLLAPGTHFTAARSQAGTVVADLGFRPDANGFGFENYGPGFTSLTPVEMRRAFGDQVCASLEGDKCILTPPAEEWMNQTNKIMDDGHCYGFSVASLRLFSGDLKAGDFGGTSTVELPIKDNDNLQRELAYAWIFQRFDSVRQAGIGGEPNAVLQKLIELLKAGKAETYTVAFFKADGGGGHAVTPYAVEDRGNGQMAVLIYDNNFPKISREMLFDTNANAWSYVASINPNEPEALYQGDANTQSLFLLPTTPGVPQQPCPFCEGQPTSSGHLARLAAVKEYNEIYLDGEGPVHGHLLITDEQGKRTGFVDGKLVNENPDILVERDFTDDLWKDDGEPIYKVPVGLKFTITIDGSSLDKANATDVVMVGPGHSIGITGIQLDPNQKDTLTVSPNGSSLVYKTDGTESPNIVVGVENPGADYEFDIKGVDMEGGGTVQLNLDDKQNILTLDTKDNKAAATYALVLTRIDDKGEQSFEHEGITLDPGDVVRIKFGDWTGQGGALTLELDKGGKGTDVETATLTDDK
jgi:hypothetical protein